MVQTGPSWQLLHYKNGKKSQQKGVWYNNWQNYRGYVSTGVTIARTQTLTFHCHLLRSWWTRAWQSYPCWHWWRHSLCPSHAATEHCCCALHTRYTALSHQLESAGSDWTKREVHKLSVDTFLCSIGRVLPFVGTHLHYQDNSVFHNGSSLNSFRIWLIWQAEKDKCQCYAYSWQIFSSISTFFLLYFHILQKHPINGL